LLFVGHLREGVDLSIVVKSMRSIRKEVSNACLAIVGTGPKLDELRRLVKDIGLSDAVRFYGGMASDEDVEDVASNCAIGVAPYVPDPTGISATGDSMKLKFYASLGLPSITTDVPAFSSEISRAKAGLVVPLDEREFAHAALKLLKDPRLLSQFSRNAKDLALQYSPEIIFGRAIAESLTLKM
jgi:glycosyltransferase involved in cell wall biosynthesis